MIKPLLEYQIREREKIELLAQVEGGRAKRELDDATRARETASGTVKSLANEAEALLSQYEAVSRSLAEVLKKLDGFKAGKNGDDEEAVADDMTFVSGLLSKVSAFETQLSDIASKSNNVKVVYDKALISAKRAQEVMASATQQYEKERVAVVPKVQAIDAELKKLATAVDSALLEKYKQIRKSAFKGDIVVPIDLNRCSGCRFELPLSLIHTVASKGYIICEECGKIIYKI